MSEKFDINLKIDLNLKINDQIINDTPDWKRIQTAAARISWLKQHSHVRALSDEKFGLWVALQRKDFEDGIAPLKSIESAKSLVKDLNLRLNTMERQNALAVKVNAATSSVIEDAYSQILKLIDVVESSVLLIENDFSDLSALTKDDKLFNTMESMRHDARPIKHTLTAWLKTFNQSEADSAVVKKVTAKNPVVSSAPDVKPEKPVVKSPKPPAKSSVKPVVSSMPDAKPEKPLVKSPKPMQRMKPPVVSQKPRTPGANKFIKTLGRKLSDLEIEQVTTEFFVFLWSNNIDQKYVGEILFYRPKGYFDLRVFDLLERLESRDKLKLSLDEFKQKFSKSDELK